MRLKNLHPMMAIGEKTLAVVRIAGLIVVVSLIRRMHRKRLNGILRRLEWMGNLIRLRGRWFLVMLKIQLLKMRYQMKYLIQD